MSFPSLRPRQPSQAINPPGAIARIAAGDFGMGSPIPGLSEVDPRAAASIYNYHEGDLFTPGTGNYVFEPVFDLPLQLVWGNSTLRKANTFSPIQPPQVFSAPNIVINGLGGLSAGDIEFAPLLNPDDQSAPFSGQFEWDPGLKG